MNENALFKKGAEPKEKKKGIFGKMMHKILKNSNTKKADVANNDNDDDCNDDSADSHNNVLSYLLSFISRESYENEDKNNNDNDASSDSYNNTLSDLLSFISTESYDSDAIREDIDEIDDNNCNLSKNINNKTYIECIKQFK